jgi:hypothetical protein
MASIDLPRPLQDYFAFAETAPTRNGRRFSITLSYVRADGRLDRLQWWYHLSPAKEMALGDSAVNTLRAEAIERFSTHIERWLNNTRQDLFGEGAIPYVAAEGNRVVTAYRTDLTVSEGLPPHGEDASENDAPAGGPVPYQQEPARQEAGSDTPTGSDLLPANKTAFG